MAEQTPIPQPDEQFGDIYESRFLKPGSEIKIPGDPETPQDFARALSYLEAITAHLIEFGPVWDKQPQEITYELDYQNCWYKYEVEQERRGGDRTSEYREINLKQLRALSQRRVMAFEDTGWETTQAYRIVTFFDHLIETAVLEQEALEQVMTDSSPEYATPIQSSPNPADDVPF